MQGKDILVLNIQIQTTHRWLISDINTIANVTDKQEKYTFTGQTRLNQEKICKANKNHKKITTKCSETKNCPQPSIKPNTENYEKSVHKMHENNTQGRNNTKRLTYKHQYMVTPVPTVHSKTKKEHK
jgi:hypothetical protein